ncbi:hypothetical protein PSHT_10970, partial [Puccinia striiformis]
AATCAQITALQEEVAAGRAEAQLCHLQLVALRDKTQANHRQTYQQMDKVIESTNQRLDHLKATNCNWVLSGRQAAQCFLPPPAR